MKIPAPFVLLTLLTAIGVAKADPGTWTQWRGPARDGLVAGDTAWPESLDSVEPVWSKPIAEGYSGPIVSATHVFTVETKDKQFEIVRAFDRETGEQVWEHQWEGAMKVPFFAAKNGSWARCTPTLDGNRLYVGGMRDVLVCLDADTGDEKWRVDFVSREGTSVPGFGFVSSPLIDGDALYVQAGAAVMRLKKDSGEKVWEALKDDRAMYGSAFSSPVIATLQGKRQLVTQTRTELAGLDLESGAVLWKYAVKAFRGMNILTPAIAGDRVFTASYGGGAFLFDVGKDQETFEASKTWVSKVEGYMSSPIVLDEHLYLHGRDQRIHCFRLADGEEVWRSDEKFGEYWSMVAKGQRILALDERGELILVAATPEKFTILARKKVTESPTWAHLAIVGNDLFVRDLKGISRYAWK